MNQYKNLYIIGSSHIAQESLDEVKNALALVKPEIVALELDRQRFAGLMGMQKRELRGFGIRAFLLNFIGAWVERRLGKFTGVMPGSEMKIAGEYALKNNMRIALIDQNIKITLKRLLKAVTFKECARFICELVLGIFKRRELPFDLRKIPPRQVVQNLLRELKTKYPNVYCVLIAERNKFMAEKLKRMMDNYPDSKILAIVGAGHEQGIMEQVKREV
ncbi:TraB/GumN family protein [archaeon]|nr:TraB/GumN family protein [archaeon]